MRKIKSHRTVRALIAISLVTILLTPTSAFAKTRVDGGPLTNLDPAGAKINLALSAFPTGPAGVGLYILQCLNSVSAGKTREFCDSARQLWISNSQGASFAPTANIVLAVTGNVAGTECGIDKCSIFVTFDHTNSADRTEDQLIPISFAAGAATPSKPKDTIAASVGGTALTSSAPLTIEYRTPVAITATAKSGGAITFGSSTPDCTVVNGILTALKGAGACNITVSTPESNEYQKTTANFPFYLSQGNQSIPAFKTTLKKGSTLKVAATTAFGETINYTVANSKICMVKNAIIKALKKGNCVIAAQASGRDGLWAETKVRRTIKIS